MGGKYKCVVLCPDQARRWWREKIEKRKRRRRAARRSKPVSRPSVRPSANTRSTVVPTAMQVQDSPNMKKPGSKKFDPPKARRKRIPVVNFRCVSLKVSPECVVWLHGLRRGREKEEREEVEGRPKRRKRRRKRARSLPLLDLLDQRSFVLGIEEREGEKREEKGGSWEKKGKYTTRLQPATVSELPS